MLGNIDASANRAVKNLAVSKKFYEGTLGLTPVGSEGKELIAYRSGKTTFNVYKSDRAGTNQATAVTWSATESERSCTTSPPWASSLTINRW